jgi:hypothetical protein
MSLALDVRATSKAPCVSAGKTSKKIFKPANAGDRRSAAHFMGFNLYGCINPAPDARGFTLTPASQVKTEKSK